MTSDAAQRYVVCCLDQRLVVVVKGYRGRRISHANTKPICHSRASPVFEQGPHRRPRGKRIRHAFDAPDQGNAHVGNLRAVQLLLDHTKMDSTVRYLGVELEDDPAIARPSNFLQLAVFTKGPNRPFLDHAVISKGKDQRGRTEHRFEAGTRPK